MDIFVPHHTKDKVLIGEYPNHQTGELRGLLDFSGIEIDGVRKTNFQILDLWAKSIGAEISVEDAVTEEARLANRTLEIYVADNKWVADCFLSAVILDTTPRV